jgi:hypothetical protein
LTHRPLRVTSYGHLERADAFNEQHLLRLPFLRIVHSMNLKHNAPD